MGKLAKQQMILPPVDCNADIAALIVGSKADSGLLTRENKAGNCSSKDVMTALRICQYTLKHSIALQDRHTLIHRDPQKDLHSEGRMVPPNQSSPSSVLCRDETIRNPLAVIVEDAVKSCLHRDCRNVFPCQT